MEQTDQVPSDRDELLNEILARIELEKWFGADLYPIRPDNGETQHTPAEPAAADSDEMAVVESPNEKQAQLDELFEAMKTCHQCQFGDTRTKLVFGEGNPDARLMFVGEAPGADEDRQGRPFVGRAGQLLTRMIEAMGLQREDVYIGNILKCRPPNNRTPTPAEMTPCLPYILKQIEIIEPEIICGLGAVALKGLLRDPSVSIGRIRGAFIDWHGVRLMPTYHPAYLLRSPQQKKVVWEDLQAILRELGLEPPPRRGS